MPHEMSPGKPTTRRYSEAEKERAVRAVRQLRKELGTDHGTVNPPAGKFVALHYSASRIRFASAGNVAARASTSASPRFFRPDTSSSPNMASAAISSYELSE